MEQATTCHPRESAEALQRLRELKAARRPVRIETTLGSDHDPKKQPGALFRQVVIVNGPAVRL